MWFLGWTRYAIVHHQYLFFTNHINYPFGVNLAWNPLMPLPGAVLSPVTGLLGPIFSYNSLVTLNVIGTGVAAYLAFGRFVTSKMAAFLGGTIYAFSPYMMAQSRDHPSLTAGFFPPLLLIVLSDILVWQRKSHRRAGVALGIIAAGQLYTALEPLACELIAACVALVVLLAFYRREARARARHVLKACGYAGAVFAVVTALPVYALFLGPQRIHGRLQPPNVYVADVTNFVVPTAMQTLSPGKAVALSARWTGNLSEADAYIGVPLLLVCLLSALLEWRRPIVKVSVLAGGVLAVLSLGPNLHVNGKTTSVALPWQILGRVPFIENVLPSRLALVVDLFVGLLAAVFADRICHARSRRLVVVGSGLLAATVVSLIPVIPYPATRPAIPKFFDKELVGVIPPGSVALVAPFQELYPSEPMLWQASADMRYRMPQGYFVRPDKGGKPVYGAPRSALSIAMLSIQEGKAVVITPEARQQLLRDLRERDVETVVLAPMPHQAEMAELFSFLLDGPGEPVEDVLLWRNVRALVSQG